MSVVFYVLDTETTGLKCGFHSITQLCAIRTYDRMQFARTIRCEYPERAQAEALQITGKTFDDLRCGDESIDVVNEFEEYLAKDGKKSSGRCIICHNASFDRRFLQALWSEHGRKFPADLWVDTVPMARNWSKKQGMEKAKTNLMATAEMLGTKKVKGVHNAISDTQNLFFIWNKFIELGEDYLPHIKLMPHVDDDVK